MNKSIKLRLLHFALLSMLTLCACSVTNAQLIANVDVNVSEEEGVYTYDYTVSNGLLSSSSINGFLLTVASGDDVVLSEPDDFLGELVGYQLEAPTNWTGAYQPFTVSPPCAPEAIGTFARDYQAAWVAGDGLEVSPLGEDDLFPGEQLNFSLQSRYAPVDQDYLLVNVTPGCETAEFLGLAEGTVQAPGIAPAIPALACDFDGDGDCDLQDIDQLSVAVGTDDLNFDFNSDGVVSAMDINDFLASSEVNRIHGDADFNGTVEFADFLILSNNFGQAGVYSTGDFDGSNDVAFADFLILSDNFGSTISAETLSSVPEPSASLLCGLMLCGLLPFRKSSRA